MLTLIEGDASKYTGAADVVFTHPYAPIPEQLRSLPMFLNLYTAGGQEPRKRRACQAWAGRKMYRLGSWGQGTNTLYVANLPVRYVEIESLEVVPPGWFPEELVRRCLAAYRDLIPEGATIWDGFMGRGTVGKVCAEMGYRYVGIDRDPERVRLAREYLGCAAR